MQDSDVKGMIVVQVVDDHLEDLSLIKEYLSPKGYQVLAARTGKEAVEIFKSHEPHIVILDYVLPDFSGHKVCEELKSHNSNVPVLMLSVRGDTQNKIGAFKSGCDDYMTKPCELEELEIRIQNLLKRSHRTKDVIYRIGDIEINTAARRITKAGLVVELTVKEYSLLEYLVKNPNKVLTRSMILENVWGEDSGTFTNIVDVYVNYLRKKLDLKTEVYIKTVRGIGYLLEQSTATAKAA